MATYVIGDIQGCFDPFERLLKQVNFNHNDELWIAGDLVNRGEKSLETLRFVKGLGKQAKVVLGNHDLHLLAIHYSHARIHPADTLQAILQAPDCESLMHWLRQQPLLHYDPVFNTVMTHAGIPFIWSLKQAISLAGEVQQVISSQHYLPFFEQMYGNKPSLWDASLTGLDRLRCITNYFTRMRFCNHQGELDLLTKGERGSQPAGFHPWFEFERLDSTKLQIVFGHWAALQGETGKPSIQALDTGCVWGESLTILRLDDNLRFSEPAQRE